MARASETSYQIINARDFPGELPQWQLDAVDELVKYSLYLDFPDRSHREINEFCAQARQARYEGLNAAVGGPLLRRDQSYRNARYALAFRGDELAAYLPAADNASSKHNYEVEGIRGAMKGAIERQAKLRLTEFSGKDWIGHRYLWLGHAALNEEVRAKIQENPEEVNELDMLLSAIVRRHDGRQPVSVFPYANEHDWKAGLTSIGLNKDPHYSEPIRAFGESAKTVGQEHWVGQTAAGIEQALLAKYDPTNMLGGAMQDGDS